MGSLKPMLKPVKQPVVSMHTEDVALFSTPPINTAEEKISWIEYRPTFINKDGNSSVQFHIPGNSVQYIDLGKTELYVVVEIIKEDYTEFADNQSGLPIDMILHTMWNTVDVKLNQNLISTSGTNYMYKAFFENLLNYNANARKFQMAAIGFSGERGDLSATSPKGRSLNKGLTERSEWFKGVSCVEFMGPLMADICNQDRLILNGVDIDIKLWPNRDEFQLICHPETVRCKLNILDIYLNVCKVSVSLK